MPATIERRESVDERLYNPKLAPPGDMFKTVQDKHGLQLQVSDRQSIMTIDKSNAVLGSRIMRSLKACMLVSKRTFGNVGGFSKVFSGLRNILR